MARQQRILVKVGGAQLEQPGPRADLCRSVALAREAGFEIVLVHGGGNQIRDLVRKLGLPESYHNGLRVTDAATADVVLMVLAGLVNKELVHALETSGVRACGLSGADGGTFQATKRRDDVLDLGYVGEVGRTDVRLVDLLLRDGILPVIATAAPLQHGEDAPDDRFYNVNADMAAGPLSRAVRADVLLFLTDVPGVLDAAKQRIPELTPEACAELRLAGVIHGGMIPKVDAALAALAANPGSTVKIAPAAGADAVRRALSPDVGTSFQESR
ncbi:MAG: acetylglutamate kinase [Planctomycetota bacterium]|nr:acetylglutamate kinase [Planctomycetota bacterium]